LNVSPNAGSSLTISGNISQTTPSSLTMSNSGMLILSGANTYTGGTNVTAGTLQLGDGAVKNGSVAGNIALSNNRRSSLPIPQPRSLAARSAAMAR